MDEQIKPAKKNVKWLCVVNLVGIHGPFRVVKNGLGEWWDSSGEWTFDERPKHRVKDGYRAYVYDTKLEAQCWLDGARAVANQVRSLCR